MVGKAPTATGPAIYLAWAQSANNKRNLICCRRVDTRHENASHSPALVTLAIKLGEAHYLSTGALALR